MAYTWTGGATWTPYQFKTLQLVFVDSNNKTVGRRIDIDPALTQDQIDAIVDAHKIASNMNLLSYYTYVEQINDDQSLPTNAQHEDYTNLTFAKGAKEAIYRLNDPAQSIFLATTGDNAVVVKEKADLNGAAAGTASKMVSNIIDAVIADQIKVRRKGEQVTSYKKGRKIRG